MRITLAAGESLLLYTDGATETRSAADEEFGVHRMAALASRCAGLSPDRLLECCIADISRFAGAKKMSDDLTLLALQRVE